MKKLKIMVTGKNSRIAKDICSHLAIDRDYSVIRCAPSREALFEAVPKDMPRVIIICLGDEKKETIKQYDILKECAQLGGFTVIVVTNTEDKELFIKHTNLERMFFLSRPVSLYALYDKLEELDKKYSSDEEELALLTEYINPNSDKITRKQILAVDDNAEQLMQIKEHLKEFYDVTLVSSGEAAFKFLSKRKPDIILLDYMMPDMDGPQVYRALKENLSYADIPVVFLTGVKEKSKVIKTLVELKPQGYIVKPSKKSELVAKIIDVIG